MASILKGNKSSIINGFKGNLQCKIETKSRNKILL